MRSGHIKQVAECTVHIAGVCVSLLNKSGKDFVGLLNTRTNNAVQNIFFLRIFFSDFWFFFVT